MGGWGYLTYSGFSKRPAAQPTSFLTGTVLISAWMAGKSFGLSLDDKIFTRALKFLKSQRTPVGTYVYSLSHSFYPGRPINRHTGSLARTPACDYAIRLWEPEDISLRQLVDGLDRLWSRRGWLTMALHKPTPHEISPRIPAIFFYYGYYYSGMCLDMLAPNQVKRHASLLADDILTRQGTDGAWWDYPLYNYHKFYGTGYALYALFPRLGQAVRPTGTFSILYFHTIPAMINTMKSLLALCLFYSAASVSTAETPIKHTSFRPGEIWTDNNGAHQRPRRRHPVRQGNLLLVRRTQGGGGRRKLCPGRGSLLFLQRPL